MSDEVTTAIVVMSLLVYVVLSLLRWRAERRHRQAMDAAMLRLVQMRAEYNAEGEAFAQAAANHSPAAPPADADGG